MLTLSPHAASESRSTSLRMTNLRGETTNSLVSDGAGGDHAGDGDDARVADGQPVAELAELQAHPERDGRERGDAEAGVERLHLRLVRVVLQQHHAGVDRERERADHGQQADV